MTIGLVIRRNGRLTVSLPDGTALPEGIVDVRTEGETVVLMPSTKPYGMHLLELMEQLGETIEVPEDLPVQHREGL